MSSTQTQSRLCIVTPMSSCVQCHISFRQFSSSVATFVFVKIFAEVFTWVYRYERIYMVFTTGRFLEVSIESWSEWSLSLDTHNEAVLNNLEELQCSADERIWEECTEPCRLTIYFATDTIFILNNKVLSDTKSRVMEKRLDFALT